MGSDFIASPGFLLVIYLWSLFWKGIALWRSANLKQRNWFVAILVLNTVGIVEIAYLFKFAEKRLTLKELQSWLPASNK